MKRDQYLNLCAGVLIGICFILSAIRIFNRTKQETDPNQVTLRFSHWQLEGGVREGFDLVAQEYMKLHPNVRVIQAPVPERVYPNWVTTQLVGENPPDMILIGKGVDEERLARYFIPLTPYVSQPNPYNKGTELEHIPWSNTYLDGLQGGYSNNLLEYYGISVTMYVTRLFYNKELLKELTGLDAPPDNYQDFIKLCETIEEVSSKKGNPILPIAGSKYNTPSLVDYLFSSQTQSIIRHPTSNFTLSHDWSNLTSSYWAKEWTLHDPSFLSGLQIMRDVTQHMQPGFLSLSRDDATFYFVQQKAVMITTGSWDRTSLNQETAGIFHVGVCRLPLPTPGSEGLGKHVLGSTSEGTSKTGMINSAFGIPRNCKHFEIALDFLQFLSSQKGNQLFVTKSGWLPSILGVEIPPDLEPFRPNINGYPPGFTVQSAGLEARRLIDTNLHLLYSRNGGVDAFLKAVEPKYADTIANDIRILNRTNFRRVQRSDTPLEALRFLNNRNPIPATLSKMDNLTEAQNATESLVFINNFNLRNAGYSLKQ